MYLRNVYTARKFQNHCFEMLMRAQVVHMKIVMEPLRNSEGTVLSTQNLTSLRNFLVLAQILSFLLEIRV